METAKHKILPANYCVSRISDVWWTAPLMWRRHFEVMEIAAHSTALDPLFSAPSLPAGVTAEWKRKSAAALAWRHPNSNLTACHVCDWIKGTEEEGWLLKLLLREIMWDLMRGSSLRCSWQTGALHGKEEDVPDTGVHCYIWQAVVNPSILIPAVTKTRWEWLLYARVRTDLCFWQYILIIHRIQNTKGNMMLNCFYNAYWM